MQLRSVLTIDGAEVVKCKVAKFNGIEVYERTIDGDDGKNLFFVNESTKEVLVKMEILTDCNQNTGYVSSILFENVKK